MTSNLPDSPAAIFAQLLIDLGLASDPSENGTWPVRATGEVDSPDNLLTVYDTTGRGDGRSGADGFRFQHYGVQVRVRSSLPADGRAKAAAIASVMDEQVSNVAVTIVDGEDGTTTYAIQAVVMSGTINSLGRGTPGSKRSLFTVNFLVPIVALGIGPIVVDEDDGILLWD